MMATKVISDDITDTTNKTASLSPFLRLEVLIVHHVSFGSAALAEFATDIK